MHKFVVIGNDIREIQYSNNTLVKRCQEKHNNNANHFEDAAVTAIHQGSGGLLRKANHLARGGALIAAARQDSIRNMY